MSRAFLFVLLAACSRELPLPEKPTAPLAPRIDSFAPEAGFSGDLVHLALAGTLGPDEVPEVSFGGAPTVRLAREAEGWSVRVPDDARSGPLTLMSKRGREATEASFRHRGLGRLRLGRIVARTNFRTPAAGSFALAGRGIVGSLVDSVAERGALTFDGPGVFATYPAVDGLVPLAIAQPADGSLLAIAGDAIQGLSSCAQDGPRTALAILPASGVTLRNGALELRPSAGACLPARKDAHRVSLAVDDDGTHALVVFSASESDADEAWFVDVAARTSTRVPTAAGKKIRSPAWVGAGRFVLAEGAGLREVRIDAPLANTVAAFELLAARETVLAVAGEDGTLVAGTSAGRVRILSLSDWPPVRVADVSGELTNTDPENPDAWVSSVSFDARTRTVVSAQQRFGRVRIFRLVDGLPVPVADAEIERPAAVKAFSDGTVRVAGAGGSTSLSQLSGAILGFSPLSRRFHTARIHPSRCGDRTRSTVTIAGWAFAKGYNVDAKLLAQLEPCPFTLYPEGVQDGVQELLAHPETGVYFTTYRTKGLARIGVDPAEITVDRTFGSGRDRAWPWRRLLSFSADAKYLVANDVANARIVLADASVTDWSATPPANIPWDEPAVDAAADLDGRLYVASERAVRIYSLAAALQNRSEIQGDPITTTDPILRARVLPHGLLLALRRGDSIRLAILDGATRELADLGEAIAFSADFRQLAVSPSGRQAALLYRDNTDLRVVRLVALDLERRATRFEGEVELSKAGGEEFFDLDYGPDGEHVVTADYVLDGLVMLE